MVISEKDRGASECEEQCKPQRELLSWCQMSCEAFQALLWQTVNSRSRWHQLFGAVAVSKLPYPLLRATEKGSVNTNEDLPTKSLLFSRDVLSPQ
jgi:hypothetical protein